VKAFTSLVDVMPTLFDYMNRGDLGEGCRGTSRMPLLRGTAAAPAEEMRVTGMRHNKKMYYKPLKEKQGDINIVVRQGQWKGIWNVQIPSFELYELRRDPREERDLSTEERAQAAAMRDFASRWVEECRRGAMKPRATGIEGLDRETVKKLQHLGYLEKIEKK
jgi:arylsulfatase A-like enzyme